MPSWFTNLQAQLITSAASAYEPDLQVHEWLYSSELAAGHNLIIVAHSQGNLYAKQAYDAEVNIGNTSRFHVIEVATPTHATAGSGAYFTLQGDVITLIPGSLTANIINDAPSPCPSGPSLSTASVACHSFDDSYMDVHAGDKTRPSIINSVLAAAAPATYAISTIAGNGTPGFFGDGDLATKAELWLPSGLAIDSAFNLFVSDINDVRIRRVSRDGLIATVAGNGSRGSIGDGGPAIDALLDFPEGLAIDTAGNLYIADDPILIRKISPDGTITRVAGDGYFTFVLGDGGLATSADLYGVSGVAVDIAGNFYIADGLDHRIRKVSPDGIIETTAGTGIGGYGSQGGFSGDGGLAINAELNGPSSVTVANDGTLYIADSGNNRIRKVTSDGIITTVAGNGIRGYSGDNGLATSAELDGPTGVAVDSVGNLLIADFYNNRIRRVSLDGVIVTIAGNGTYGYSGDGGQAVTAEFAGPWALVIDSENRIYVSDQGNSVVRMLQPQ